MANGGGFLNVDVELEGNFDRVTLRDALGEAVVVLQDTEVDGVQRLAFESTSAARSAEMGPDIVIGLLVGLVRQLPPAARAAWDAAERRVFDLGFEGRAERRAWRLGASTLAEVVEVGGEVAITLYA